MFKQITTGLALLISTVTFSQVGIGTTTPHTSADLELGSANKALYLNRVANPVNDIASPQEGMVVYDTTLGCVRVYQGNPAAWSACSGLGFGVTEGSITSFNCASAAFSPSSAVQNQPYSGTLTLPYTGGDGGNYPEDSFTLGGLDFFLAEGSYVNGNGNLVYTISGTPTTVGNVSVDVYQNGGSCTGLLLPVNAPVGTLASLDCSAALAPVAYAGTTSYSGSFTVSYTGGNAGTYAAQSLASTGAGFTATLAAGTLASGAGSVTYNVTSATVPAAGNYTFNITLGGQSCTKTITVSGASGILPSGFNLAQNRRHFIASVYDTDYLPYTAPTGPATTDVVSPGTAEPVTVDYQGTLTTTGVTVQIPVASVTGNGTVGAWSSTFVVPAAYTQDGISRTLELVWASQSVTASSKFITATIRSVGGTFNAKKLDINAGIGNDYLGFLLGSFQYPYNNGGSFTGYQVRDIPGIPDKKFGQLDNTPAAGQRHNFLYLPIQAEDGNIWLNNNLGADYANLGKPDFNLTQQATSYTDYKAYGSLFQWGRNSDGHELTNRTSSTATTAVTGSTTTKSDNPGHSLFIQSANFEEDWAVSSNTSRWATEASANNPCPNGFRVPTTAEYNTLFTAANITNRATGASSALKFTGAGSRLYDGTFNSPGTYGEYWSSTAGGGLLSFKRTFATNDTTSESVFYRIYGNSIRCIKN